MYISSQRVIVGQVSERMNSPLRIKTTSSHIIEHYAYQTISHITTTSFTKEAFPLNYRKLYIKVI